MRSNVVAVVCGCVVIGLAGCGGDDGDDKAGGSGSGDSGDAPAKKAPSHAQVLSCLKGEGLDAKDQSSSFGPTIGIDYAAGRATISFQDSEQDAKDYASAGETNGDTTSVKGKIAITLPDDPEAEAAQSTVEGCVE